MSRTYDPVLVAVCVHLVELKVSVTNVVFSPSLEESDGCLSFRSTYAAVSPSYPFTLLFLLFIWRGSVCCSVCLSALLLVSSLIFSFMLSFLGSLLKDFLPKNKSLYFSRGQGRINLLERAKMNCGLRCPFVALTHIIFALCCFSVSNMHFLHIM